MILFMRGTKLNPDSRKTLCYYGKEKTYYINAFLQQF